MLACVTTGQRRTRKPWTGAVAVARSAGFREDAHAAEVRVRPRAHLTCPMPHRLQRASAGAREGARKLLHESAGVQVQARRRLHGSAGAQKHVLTVLACLTKGRQCGTSN